MKNNNNIIWHLVPWQRQKSPRFRRSTFCSSYQTLPIAHYVKLITVKKRNRKQESTHYVSSTFQLTLIGTRSALWYSTLICTWSSYERCILTALTCTFHHLDFNTLTCMVHAHYPAHRSVSLDRSILQCPQLQCRASTTNACAQVTDK